MIAIMAQNRAVGVGQVRRYPAEHTLGWVERFGVRTWAVTFPGRPAVRFDSEGDGTEYADGVQGEADRRQRAKKG